MEFIRQACRGTLIQNFLAVLNNRKLLTIFASSNRYFIENSRWGCPWLLLKQNAKRVQKGRKQTKGIVRGLNHMYVARAKYGSNCMANKSYIK